MKQALLTISVMFVLYMGIQFLGLLSQPEEEFTLDFVCKQEVKEYNGCASDICCQHLHGS